MFNGLEFGTKRGNRQTAIWKRSLDQDVKMPILVGYCYKTIWKQWLGNQLRLANSCNWRCSQNASLPFYGACRRNHFHCLSNCLFCTDACHLFDSDNQSTIDYVNNNTCDECHYDNVSKNADEWKRLYVKAFNTTFCILYFYFVLCILFNQFEV